MPKYLWASDIEIEAVLQSGINFKGTLQDLLIDVHQDEEPDFKKSEYEKFALTMISIKT